MDISREIPSAFNGNCASTTWEGDGKDESTNKALAFYRIKEETFCWHLTFTYNNPTESNWKEGIFEQSKETPIVVIGSMGTDSTKYVIFAYNNQSSIDNAEGKNEYNRRTSSRWSLDCKPFGGLGSTYQLRVYIYAPSSILGGSGTGPRITPTGDAKAWLEANLFVPVDEHEHAATFPGKAEKAAGLSIVGSAATISVNPKSVLEVFEPLGNNVASQIFAGVSSVTLKENSLLGETTFDQLLDVLSLIFFKPSILNGKMIPRLNNGPSSTSTSNSGAKELSSSNGNNKEEISALIASTVLPHTLILNTKDCLNDDVIVRIIQRQIAGLGRLVLTSVKDLNRIASALEESRTLEEIVLPAETKTPITKELCESIIRFSQYVALGDARQSYESPPAKRKESIQRMLPEVKDLTDLRKIRVNDDAIISFRSSSGKAWIISRDEARYCGMVQRALRGESGRADDDDKNEDEGGMLAMMGEGEGRTRSSVLMEDLDDGQQLPDASLMKPTPSDEAVVLAQHFVQYFTTEDAHENCLDLEGTSSSMSGSFMFAKNQSPKNNRSATATTTVGGSGPLPSSTISLRSMQQQKSRWNSHFEAFFACHIQSASSSPREVIQQCWLLGELWGISCYLDIPTLRAFCREAWVRLATSAKIN